jgi:UDPglucose 6-dehydrogenase
MRVCVVGLWHLGCVTAACLARAGHDVVGLDDDAAVVAGLKAGRLPLFEPGLDDLTAAGVAAGRLRFTDDPSAAAGAEIAWITYDTPVDENDVPDVAFVVDRVHALLPHLPDGCLVLISSQVPVGTTRRLAEAAAAAGRTGLSFGYSPENLRLGRAIEVFTRPDRVVVGLQSEADRPKVAAVLAPLTDAIVWMGVEAAEMTKHAINAFLATSVAFMNEIAALCEQVGADAKEVERGLKTEERIGPKAYLSPGGAFAGGTLARDIATLAGIGRREAVPVTLVAAVGESNDRHRSWPLRKLTSRLGSLEGRRIAILGLTYKPGTSTLRRSSAVELARALADAGAAVSAYDPAVPALPEGLPGIALAADAAAALAGADAVVIATPWPEFRALDWTALLASMRTPTVVDLSGFVADLAAARSAYAAVGKPWTANPEAIDD